VWVGFDDNRDLGLAGGQAAAPVWGEFMKRAVVLPKYRNTQEFEPPPGVTEAMIDPQTGQLADSSCPTTVSEHFIAGSEPTQYCDGNGAAHAQTTPGSWLKNLFGKGADSSPPAEPTPSPSRATGSSPASSAKPGQSSADTPSEESEKKKGLLDRIFGIFGSNKQPASTSKPSP
jgi:penicillin-binding protein 1B